MGDKLKLPVGIDDFEKIRNEVARGVAQIKSAEILFTTLTRQN